MSDHRDRFWDDPDDVVGHLHFCLRVIERREAANREAVTAFTGRESCRQVRVFDGQPRVASIECERRA